MKQFAEIIQPVFKYLPMLAQKKIFLYIVGMLCIIGILSKWWIKSVYKGLIKKAGNMSSANNKTLRQIKMKFENCRQLTGQVKNPEVMVNTFLRKHKTFGMTLNGIARITDLCALGCVGMGIISGAVGYVYGNGKTMAAAYILIGCTLAFALEIFDKWSDADYFHKVLVETITDFFENVVENPMESVVKRNMSVRNNKTIGVEDSKKNKFMENNKTTKVEDNKIIEQSAEKKKLNSKIMSTRINTTTAVEDLKMDESTERNNVEVGRNLTTADKVTEDSKKEIASAAEQEMLIEEVLSEFLL